MTERDLVLRGLGNTLDLALTELRRGIEPKAEESAQALRFAALEFYLTNSKARDVRLDAMGVKP